MAAFAVDDDVERVAKAQCETDRRQALHGPPTQ
jgi:hypothetical protein